MCITTDRILAGRKKILSIWHDEEDGMWQFLDDMELSEEDAEIVSLEEMWQLDPSVGDIADLPLGWMAWRKKVGGNWTREMQ
ncbi:hypothetical protein EHQ52_13085 [Leptospira koniambonensis]|uniref:DUF2185 domain-containing protein n=2 Tax=Leptospira koniambonensis TaxID=2484950 RepID=A0A4V6QLV1_9LEPT|nr:hypothetical protein EHQ52_13085 [Leptospira koniambonensis]